MHPSATYRSYSFLYSNVRSVLNKRDALSSIFDDCAADVVVLTETWLTPSIANAELFSCENNYTVYRCDRDESPGGGVLIAVADYIVSSPVVIASPLEFVCVSVHVNYQNVIICGCYRPPSATPLFCEQLHDVLNDIVKRHPHTPVVLLGDFNYPKINWTLPCSSSSTASADSLPFVELCKDFNLTQLVTQPTRTGPTSSNVLDLILTTAPDLVHSISYIPGLSDHCFVHFNLTGSLRRRLNNQKTIRDYSRGDYDSINRELESHFESFARGFSDRTVQQNWDLFKMKVESLITQYIPTYVIKGRQRSPWFSTDLKKLRNKKKRLFRQAKQNNSPVRWRVYQSVLSDYRAAIREAKRVFLNNTLPSLLATNPSKFWKTVRPSEKKNISLTNSDGQTVRCEDCCIALNDFLLLPFRIVLFRHCHK